MSNIDAKAESTAEAVINVKTVSLAEVVALLRKYGRYMIVSHRRPDGDTLGSALALKKVLEHIGKTASLACCDDIPSNCTFLFEGEEHPEKHPDADKFDMIVCVDIASESMLGELSGLIGKRPSLKIDHHAIGGDYADYSYVDAGAAAVGEIIAGIAELVGVPDSLIADPVYTAVSSDSGGFRYSSTTARTMQIASRMMKAGAKFSYINHRLFECHTYAEIRAIKVAYENISYHAGGKLAMMMITNRCKEENQLDDSDLGCINSLPREIEGVVLGITVKQDTKDSQRYKLSMRSEDPVDVSAICAIFGGGGHVRAAGGELFADSPEEAERKILDAVKKSEKIFANLQ